MNLKGKSSKQMIKLIEEDGWFLVHTVGDHRQYKHLTKSGRVTVRHPVKDLPLKLVKSILKQAGLY